MSVIILLFTNPPNYLSNYPNQLYYTNYLTYLSPTLLSLSLSPLNSLIFPDYVLSSLSSCKL